MHRPGSTARRRAALVMALAIPWSSSLAASPAPPGDAVEFNRDIRPILTKACFTCHGPDEETRKARLRLDLREAALEPARSGKTAIVPGNPDASELMQRLLTSDEDEQMPPPRSGKTLTPDQVDLVRRWIQQGAGYQEHWAYAPPRPPVIPAPPKDGSRIQNPIDALVLDRLHAAGLQQSPPASLETLIRRVSLDLTGLPPTPAEVDAFVQDARPGAYERLVERLLASPHYAERWATPWLDMARYADTNGYEKDERRTAWPWRDWVLKALGEDMTFDQFTIEQLAGDLLPSASRDQKIATGFHRNTMTNTEGGTDDEEFRVAALVDRVNTTFTVWQGTTMACAQCHTHKYDPFTKKEYYQILAIFNQTQDRGKTLDPILPLPTPEQAVLEKGIRDRMAPLQLALDTQTPELDAALDAWIATQQTNTAAATSAWSTLAPATWSATDNVHLELQEDGSLLSTGELPDNSDYEVTLAPPPGPLTALRLEALTDPRLPNQGPGRHEESDFTLTTFAAEVVPPEGATNKVSFDLAYADFEMGGYGASAAIDDNANSGWAVAAFESANRVSRQAVFVAKEPLELAPGSKLRVVLRQQSSRAQHLLGRFRLASTSVPRADHQQWASLPVPIRAILVRPPGERTADQRATLAKHYRTSAPELAETRRQLEALRKELPRDIPSTLVMAAVEKPRETHVMLRGNFLNPGDKVEPGVPAALPPTPEGQPVDRLAFAHWLVSTNNPLTARVTVNRIWAAYFGTGLVETSEDFGSQGELPSNPALLDWLAIEFMQPSIRFPGAPTPKPWSLKHLHRVIVHSATYQQTSAVTPDRAERDPFNRLLSRGPRFRMEAEMLRDSALAISGLLDRTIGGPSVMPYQPDGVWYNPYSSDKWEESRQGQQFRRGLYTFWRRTSAYASFVVFDSPSREVCTERRPRSNTPVQALVTLNDPAFVVAANALARAIVREGGSDPAQRMDYAFRRVLARKPSPAESERMLALYQVSAGRFREAPDAARALAGVGLPLPPEEDTLPEIAAWQVVANAMLNLDEALTKG